MTTTTTKACTKCGETKGLEAFGPNRSTRDGVSSWCRECKRADDRARLSNRTPTRIDRDKARVRARRETGEAASVTRAWRARRLAEGLCEACAAPRVNARHCREHADEAAARTRRRAARSRAALLTEAAERDVFVCYLCESDLGESWHIEHPVPLSLGGPVDLTRPACAACNLTKGARYVADVLAELHPERVDVEALLSSGVFTLEYA